MFISSVDASYRGEPKKAKAEKSGFEEMTVSQLRKIAKEKGISGASKMKKSELIDSLG